MSNVDAKNAREGKKRSGSDSSEQPGHPEPTFLVCSRCMAPYAEDAGPCEKCGQPGPLLKIHNTQGMTLEDLRRWWASATLASKRKLVTARRWVASLALYVDRLVDHRVEIPDEELNLFWVRLHGVLGEIREYLDLRPFGDVSVAEAKAHSDPKLPLRAAAQARAADAVKAIHATLTRDEHIYAEWRRHMECHVFQNGFTVQVQGKVGEKRKLKGQMTIKALSEQGPIEVEELNATIRRVYAAHGTDDLSVARAFARKIKPASDQLEAAWHAFPYPFTADYRRREGAR